MQKDNQKTVDRQCKKVIRRRWIDNTKGNQKEVDRQYNDQKKHGHQTQSYLNYSLGNFVFEVVDSQCKKVSRRRWIDNTKR